MPLNVCLNGQQLDALAVKPRLGQPPMRGPATSAPARLDALVLNPLDLDSYHGAAIAPRPQSIGLASTLGQAST